MDQAKVGLEVSLVFGVAVHETDRHAVSTLACFAVSALFPDQSLADCKAHLRRYMVPSRVTIGCRDDQGDPATQRKGTCFREGFVEGNAARLHELDDHVDAQLTVAH